MAFVLVPFVFLVFSLWGVVDSLGYLLLVTVTPAADYKSRLQKLLPPDHPHLILFWLCGKRGSINGIFPCSIPSCNFPRFSHDSS